MWPNEDGKWNDRQSDIDGLNRPFACKKVKGGYLIKFCELFFACSCRYSCNDNNQSPKLCLRLLLVIKTTQTENEYLLTEQRRNEFLK